MLDYCYESGEELAVAPFLHGANDRDPQPEIESVFGWGVIVRRDPLPDGRTNILLEGKGIARLEEYQTTEPFRIGFVEKIDPDEKYLDKLEFQETFDRILYLTKRILLTEGANEELILRMNDLWTHPFPVDFISSILNFNLQKKQEILSNPDQTFKAKVLVEIVEKMNLAE